MQARAQNDLGEKHKFAFTQVVAYLLQALVFRDALDVLRRLRNVLQNT